MNTLKAELGALSDPTRAQGQRRFFKTTPGAYAAEDQWCGIAVPELRKLALRWAALDVEAIEALLYSKINEERFLALLLMIQRAPSEASMHTLYRTNLAQVNNWNLVDLSAPPLMGNFLVQQQQFEPLFTLAASPSLWSRRVAIVATLAALKQRTAAMSLAVAERLLEDTEPLIHQAVGWILREVGQLQRDTLLNFLERYGHKMPRRLFRVATEKLQPSERQKLLLRL